MNAIQRLADKGNLHAINYCSVHLSGSDKIRYLNIAADHGNNHAVQTIWYHWRMMRNSVAKQNEKKYKDIHDRNLEQRERILALLGTPCVYPYAPMYPGIPSLSMFINAI